MIYEVALRTDTGRVLKWCWWNASEVVPYANIHPASGFGMNAREKLDDIARGRVNDFRRHEEVIRQHHEAEECWECEGFLQLGIEAFQWLIRLDKCNRDAVLSGSVGFSEAADEKVRDLFRGWLEPCPRAIEWANVQQQRGYTLDNVEEFRNCYEEAKAIVEAFDEVDELPQSFAALRNQALEDFRNGQTTEFI